MAIDTTQGRRKVSQNRHYLAYRETIMITLGLMETRKLTYKEFYSLYKRVHQRMLSAGLVEFDLPSYDAFNAMLRKLIKLGEIEQVYHQQNYILSLTDSGQATFDIIMSNLESHPKIDRLLLIVEFYRKSPFI